jgi:4-amino-4-deoxy-L-arabinose transferase-like glycosyltransferase
MRTGLSLLSAQRHWLVLMLICLVSFGAGIREVPPETHEMFVTGTVREMHARHDYLVPYFNGELRLTKPPLAYWFTAAVAKMADDLHDVQPWHARVPSVVAGMVMVLLTGVLGLRLFDPAVGLLAAALLAGSWSLFHYAHSARPDMVYAACCTAQILALVLAWQWRLRPHRQRWGTWAAWLSMGIAILSKGPQLPVMILLAFVLWLILYQEPWRLVLRTLRPGSGLVLAAAISLPWWWWLHQQPVTATALAHSELSGSLLVPGWHHLFSGFYLLSALQFMLPWVIPMAVVPWYVWQMRHDADGRRTSSLLVLLTILPMLLLPLGPQLRDHYILPVMGPFSVLLAVATLQWFIDSSRRFLLGLVVLHGLLGVAAMLYLLYLDWHRHTLLDPYPLLALLGIMALIGLVSWQGSQTPLKVWLAISLVCVMSFTAAAESPSFWSQDRYAEKYLGEAVAARVPLRAPLLTMNGNEEALSFYTRRPVIKLHSLADLTTQQFAQPELPIYLAWYGKAPALWPDGYQAQIVWQGQMKGEAPLTLIRLSRMQDPTGLSRRDQEPGAIGTAN